MRAIRRWIRLVFCAILVISGLSPMALADGPVFATITLHHEFYGDAVPPIRLVPLPSAKGQLVRLHRAQDGAYTVLQSSGLHRSAEMAFLLLADDPVLRALQGLPAANDWWRIEVPQGATTVGPAGLGTEPRDPAAGGTVLGRLDLTPGDSGARDVTVTLPTLAVAWIYVVIGAPADAAVTSDDGSVPFSRAPDRVLPDGRTAAVFRSDAPIPMTRTPRETYRLTGTDPAGTPLSITLPAASPRQLTAGAGGQQGVPQAEIFVALP